MIQTEKSAVVVQMRLDSRRLPGKALLPIGDTTLAGMVMRRLRAIEVDEYILATDPDGARELSALAGECGFAVFVGPKDDVLARYAMVVQAHGLGRVVRATGDNPFVSAELARLAIQAADEGRADYVGLSGMPVGMGVEVVDARALLAAARLATSVFDREHVCPYIYGHPNVFVVLRPDCPASYHLPSGRVTVDTIEDLERARAIVSDLGAEPDDAGLLGWLRAAAAFPG